MLFFLQAANDIQASGSGNLMVAILIAAGGILTGGGWKTIQEKFKTDNLKEEVENLKLENAELKKTEAKLNEMTFKYTSLVDRVQIFYELEKEDPSIGILLKQSDKDA